MKNWYNLLCNEFNSIEIKENFDMLGYYKFSSICYAITEYIFKDLNINTNKKSQELNNKYNMKLKYIYNPYYIYNDLKHMNVRDEDTWKGHHNLNYERLGEELYNETYVLISQYSVRNVFSSKKEIYDNIIDFKSINNMMKPMLTAIEVMTPTVTVVENIALMSNTLETVIPTINAIESLTPMLSTLETVIPTMNAIESLTPMLSTLETVIPTMNAIENLTPMLNTLETVIPKINKIGDLSSISNIYEDQTQLLNKEVIDAKN